MYFSSILYTPDNKEDTQKVVTLLKFTFGCVQQKCSLINALRQLDYTFRTELGYNYFSKLKNIIS